MATRKSSSTRTYQRASSTGAFLATPGARTAGRGARGHPHDSVRLPLDRGAHELAPASRQEMPLAGGVEIAQHGARAESSRWSKPPAAIGRSAVAGADEGRRGAGRQRYGVKPFAPPSQRDDRPSGRFSFLRRVGRLRNDDPRSPADPDTPRC